jgi:hypothetical protein
VLNFVHGTDTGFGNAGVTGGGTSTSNVLSTELATTAFYFDFDTASNVYLSTAAVDVVINLASLKTSGAAYTLTSDTAMEARISYVLTGTGAADTITTGALADSITGGVGADIINSGAGADVIIYTAATAPAGGTGDLVSNSIDVVTGFTTSDTIDLTAADAALLAGGGSLGAGGVIAAMTNATTFSVATAGSIQEYDDGTDTYLRISTAADAAYTVSADIDIIKLVGITGHVFTLSSAGVISMASE